MDVTYQIQYDKNFLSSQINLQHKFCMRLEKWGTIILPVVCDTAGNYYNQIQHSAIINTQFPRCKITVM